MKKRKRILSGILAGIMAVTLLAGMPMGKDGVVNAARRTLKNPSQDSDGVVTWDCVYFGSYPQSDATGKTKEPIKWRVLSVNGNDAFLVADRNLDVQRYNDTDVDITWETCTMRSWLNGYGSNSNVCGTDYRSNNFLDRAFTPAEQEVILSTRIQNMDHPTYNTDGGNNTTDKIFLLSYDEVTDSAYGFSSNLMKSDAARKRTNTEYVAARGEAMEGEYFSNNNAWWLRSPGHNSTNAMFVHAYNWVYEYGIDVYYNSRAVCPALHLNLTSFNLWCYAGTVNSNGESMECQHENTEIRGGKEATCEDAGYGDIYCSDCDAKLKDGETIPAKGHQWDDGIITEQTTEKGETVKTFTCTVCGEKKTETVKETIECQHGNEEIRGRKEATCNETGYTGDTYCSDCDAKLKDGETIPAIEHQWDDGIITEQATEKEDAVKTFTCTVCGEKKKETVKGSSDLVGAANTTQESQILADVSKEVQEVTDASIAKQSSEDVKGAVFNTLLARVTKLTNKTITLKWKKVSKSDGYKIYGNQCGKKNHYKLIKDVGKNKTSYIQKKLKKGTYYKYVVAAYKVVDGKKVTIAVSKTIHATTTGGKYGVAKSVKVNKSKVTLKEGKKFTIKATEVKKDKKIKNHRKIAYESSNTKVATVSTKGVIKAKKKGTCYIYAYAQNGVYKRVKVTVK